MKEDVIATFNPASDINYAITPGVYPAHIIKFSERELKNGKFFVYNLTFRIAEEAANMNIDFTKQVGDDRHLVFIEDENGDKVKGKADVLVGREIRDNGTFFTPGVKDGEGWKNNNYRDLCKNLNVEIPTKNDIEFLGRLEEDDVIAKPCRIKVDLRQYKKKDESIAYALNVTEIFPWESGEMLSDEIIESLTSENEKPAQDPGF